MLYYKVFRDRDFTRFIRIDETEIEKALAAFRFGTSVMFKDGALEKVGDILPDYNGSMGWNPSYTLQDDDWSDIRSKGVDRKLKTLLENTKNKIDYLVETNKQHLIGKNVEVKLPENNKEISSGVSMLADKMKI